MPGAPGFPGYFPLDAGLLGRSDELRRLQELLVAETQVTLIGPGGIGKSALAAAAAAQHAARGGRSWWVDLRPLASLDDLLAAVASVLHLPPAAVASPAALARALRPLALLLVLDGAEVLGDAVAEMIGRWRQEAPQVQVVVTSRRPLDLPGERILLLGGLANDDALRLIARTMAAVRPGAALQGEGEARAASEIAQWLEGSPQGLQLAGAQAVALGAAGLRDALRPVLRFAAQPVEALLGWVLARLDPQQQTVFRRLATFAAAFTAESARAVCGGERDAPDALAPEAVDAALAGLRRQGLVGDDGDRLRLSETARQAAAARLPAAEAERCAERHLQATLAHWRGLFERCYAEPILDWVRQARDSLDNWRQAMGWALQRPAQGAAAIELLACTPLVWARLGLRVEGRHWCDRLRPLLLEGPPAPMALQAAYWLTVATQGVFAFQYTETETRSALSRALPALRAGSDVWRTILALYLEVLALERAGRAADGQPLADEMAALEPAEWNWNRRQLRRSAQALIDRAAGRVAEYQAFCRSELAQHRRLGQRAESWTAAHHLALAEQDAGRPQQAIDALDQAHDEICAAGAQRQFATLIALRATMLAEQGDLARTDAALAQALPVLQSAGTAWMLDDAWAWRSAHADRHADAARLLGRADRALQVRGSTKRSAYLQRSYLALRARLEGALGGAELQRLLASGAGLDADSALALARK